MPETKIVRTEVITVQSATKDQYGNLIVTDTQGQEHKIGVKRSALFPVFQPGAEVKIGYGNYMNKDYIATAEQTGNHAPTPAVNNTANVVKSTVPAPQEIGMWQKELGELIRSGQLDKDYPKFAVKIKSIYYTKMFEVLGIKVE